MKISVLIPAYNAAITIEDTLASVFRQTIQPDEIIVLLDGCTDDTFDRIERFKDRITIVSQENKGLAITRNRLVEMAKGDLLAFLDSDDIWHPKYLEVQQMLMQDYPEALVSVTYHANFKGGGTYLWQEEPDTNRANAEWIKQEDFFDRYNVATGQFQSPSFACIRKSAICRMGNEPFQFGGVCDTYLFYQVSLWGGVVFFKSPLAAYRVSAGSMSANGLLMVQQWIAACEKLEPQFQNSDVKGLIGHFRRAFASKRRLYAKMLLGLGRFGDARHQLLLSIANCHQPVSIGKSLAIWAVSFLPSSLQPKWPSASRDMAHYRGLPQASSAAVGRVKS